MKTKKLIALLLAICTLLTLFVMPVGATEEHQHEEIEIVILNEDLTEEQKARIIERFSNPENLNGTNADDGATTYNLLCNIFGHKIEGTGLYSIAHTVRATPPRCLRNDYYYEFCTRCDDYERQTLTSTSYIFCCP